LSAKKLLLGAALVIIASGCYIAFIITLPPPKFWVSLTASTERISFKVANPDLAILRVTGMEVYSDMPKLTGCVSGLLSPQLDSTVEYRRGDDSYFTITVDRPGTGRNGPVAVFQSSSDGRRTELGGPVQFRAKDDCGSAMKRLPIWGDAQFGERVGAPDARGEIVPGMLVSGTVETFAYSHDRLLGLRFPSTVYSVNSFDLPAGSVLTRDATASAPPLWSGAAVVSDDGSGFQVYASTTSHSVALTAPVGGTSAVDLGNYSQFLSDPNIIKIQFFGGVFLFLAQSILIIFNFILAGADLELPAEREKPARSPSEVPGDAGS
jgi:hypothetical protein